VRIALEFRDFGKVGPFEGADCSRDSRSTFGAFENLFSNVVTIQGSFSVEGSNASKLSCF
jgi:hypothetical protein